jgi:hypothetical protein
MARPGVRLGPMADEDDTERLRAETLQRELLERTAADEADEPAEEHQHERRADKAAYLEEKLAERERSERDG